MENVFSGVNVNGKVLDVQATYDSEGNNIAESLSGKLSSDDLKTINGESIVGNGNITITSESEELKKANLQYNRYLEDTVSTEAKPYIKEIRNATLDMEEFGKLGTGLFIHWGVYAVPAGTYTGPKVETATVTTTKLTRNCEWALRDLGIPLDTYKAFESQFTGTNFNPTEIVQIAKDCGMKYIVITFKHHEGFSLYPTQYGNWDIRTSECRNTVLDELKAACDANGLKFGAYYSQYWDWEAEGGYGLNHGGKWTTTDPYTSTQHSAYIETVKNQLNEIVEKYKPYIMWYDPGTNYTDGCKEKLRSNEMNYVDVICNDRLGYNRDYGDYGTGERTIYLKNTLKYGEACFTLNNTWGYSENNETESWYYSPEKIFKEYLLYTLSYGQNCLMNLGPKADGSLSDLTKSRLNSMKTFIQTYCDGSFYNYKKMSSITRPNWGYMIGFPGNKVKCFVTTYSNTDYSEIILDGIDTTMLDEDNGVTILTPGTNASYEILDDYRIQLHNFALDSVTKIGVVELQYTTEPMKLDEVCAVENSSVSTGVFPVNSTTSSFFDISNRIYKFAPSKKYSLGTINMRWLGDTEFYSARVNSIYSSNQSGTLVTSITVTDLADSSKTQTFTISTTRSSVNYDSSEVLQLVNGHRYSISYSLNGTDANVISMKSFSFFKNATAAVSGVDLDKDTATFGPAESVIFTAEVQPANAGNKNVSFSIDNADLILDYTGLNSNQVKITSTSTEDKTGTLTVTTEDGGFTDTAIVNYNIVEVESVSVEPSTSTLPTNQTEALTLTASVLPADASFKTITWSSSDETIATVNSEGKVSTLNTEGNVTITATSINGVIGTCVITVENEEVIPVTSITLDKSSLDLQECEMVEVTATVLPETATFKELNWTSDNENVVVVRNTTDSTKATIIAKEGFSGTANITVKPQHTPIGETEIIVTIPVSVELETSTYSFEQDSLDGNDSAILQDTNLYPFGTDLTNFTLFGWAYGSENPADVNNATLYQCVVNGPSPWTGLRIDADNNAVKITDTNPAPLRPRYLAGSDTYLSMRTGEATTSSIHDSSPNVAGLTIHPFYFTRETPVGKTAASDSTYYWSFDGKNWTVFTGLTAAQLSRLTNCMLTVGYDYKRASSAMTTERYRFLKTEGLADSRVCVKLINQSKYKFAKSLKNYDLGVKESYDDLTTPKLSLMSDEE